ncbi:unnamed protein product [Polarella glacialis]|uniref:PDEase domain-containing protein n=1 Tax=Polarella glacialis TaxID=89957 RepID=A0A813EP53_POLGL|nr:unnamed protein product [Polarella glacialis]
MADAPRYKTFGTALDRARSSTGAPRRSTVPEEGKSAEREQLPFSLSESDQLLSEGEPLHDLLASSASSLAQKARRAREAAAAAARGRAKARDRPAEGEGPTEEGPTAPPESESRPSAPPEAASEEGPRAPPESASRPSAPPEAASEEAPTEEALAARSERKVLEPPARARETVCQDPRAAPVARPVQPRLGGGGDFAAAGRSGRLEAPRVGDAVEDGSDAWRSLERQSRPLEAGAAAEPNQVPSPAADGGEGQFLKGEASPTEAEEAPPKEAKVLRSELKEERSPKVTRISADSESSESEESQAIELSEQEQFTFREYAGNLDASGIVRSSTLFLANLRQTPGMVKDLQMIYQMNTEVFEAAENAPGDHGSNRPHEGNLSNMAEIEIFGSAETKVKVMDCILHSADVSNPCRTWEVTHAWALVCLEEFFAQGDQEKIQNLPVQFLNDRDKLNKPNSQIGFIEFMIAPFFAAQVRLWPAMAELGNNMVTNLGNWQDLWVSESNPGEEEKAKVKGRVDRVRNNMADAIARKPAA